MSAAATLLSLVLLLGVLVAGCAGGDRVVEEEGTTCGPAVLAANADASVARPNEALADHSFAGELPEQTEFVWLGEEGRADQYDYMERWNWGVPGEPAFQLHVGWDWKVGCRIERCNLPEEVTCCYQVCAEGGSWGLSWEPPDRFGCMNRAAGGRYQWFLDGLHEAGVGGLDACLAVAPRGG